MNRYHFLLSLLFLTLIPDKAIAHGAYIEYEETAAVTIQAKYDDGKPMANAQVVIYAPQDPTVPWLKGNTDDEGSFTFVPDVEPQNSGNWDVKVRQAGHGTIVSIPLTNNKLTSANRQQLLSSTGAKAGYSPSQKLVMAAAVGWGFIGTALFFARSKSSHQ
ncbi:MAG: carboxypeptidase-like regulatory domain-containing protein [Cyanobacteria bacterium J06621_8]